MNTQSVTVFLRQPVCAVTRVSSCTKNRKSCRFKAQLAFLQFFWLGRALADRQWSKMWGVQQSRCAGVLVRSLFILYCLIQTSLQTMVLFFSPSVTERDFIKRQYNFFYKIKIILKNVGHGQIEERSVWETPAMRMFCAKISSSSNSIFP